MSYFATFHGNICFEQDIESDKEASEKVLGMLYNAYGIDVNDSDIEINICQDICNIDLMCAVDYDEDEVLRALETLNWEFKLVSGEIRYQGEDESLWRHILINTPNGNVWVEQEGFVCYR